MFAALVVDIRAMSAGVLIAPLLDDDAGFLEAVEDLLIEALVAQLAVEGFAISVFPCMSGAMILSKRRPMMVVGSGCCPCSSSKEIWQAAADGDIDIGLAFNPARSPALQMIREVGFRLGVVVDPEHPFAKLPQVKLAACAQGPIILPDRTMSLRDGIDRSASGAGVELHPLIQASSPGIIKSMVAERTGIALLTFIDVVNEVRLGKLVFVPLADRDLPVSYLSLMTPSNRYMTAAAALMARHLTETLDALAQTD